VSPAPPPLRVLLVDDDPAFAELITCVLPRMDGLEATRRIVGAVPGASVLVVSSSKDPEDVERARDAGAAGYLPKDRAATELREWLELLRPALPSPDWQTMFSRMWGWKFPLLAAQ
jgi:DNA-binding NarL/FixJ family response regulator